MVSGSSADQAGGSSRVHTIPVNGPRIAAPTTAANPRSAQNPGNTTGNQCPTRAPSAPPIMNSGASTPPEVPDPSDNEQIAVFTISIPTMSDSVAWPVNSAAITS